MTYYLFNPLAHSVEMSYTLDEIPQLYVLPPEKISEFENEVVFDHLRAYLIEIILNERNIVHFDHNREQVREEVTKYF